MNDSPLPLDRYPHITFQNRDAGEGHTFGQKRDDDRVTFSGAVKSVTPAVVTHYDQVTGARFCIMCGEKLSFRARRTKKTCSATCRKAASRRHESIGREVLHVKDALLNLERYSDQWPDLYWQIMQAIGQCGIAASSTSRRVAPKGDSLPGR